MPAEVVHPRRHEPITAVVVTHESRAVLEPCLAALLVAAPRRGVDVRVVDNASSDGSSAIAARMLGEGNVIRLAENHGFAAGVNAVLAGFSGTWLALVNPDLVVPRGALDVLADELERQPQAGLVAPRVCNPRGRPEASVGFFPTLEREHAHALFLDRLCGQEGRRRPFPRRTGPVDWASGCAWLLRGDAARTVGVLDEGYFMYFEDVDYCRRLHEERWEVIAVPEVLVVHAGGGGSARSPLLPADGGGVPVMRYFRKFEPRVSEAQLSSLLARGWRLRLIWHRMGALLGDPRARMLAHRYREALRAMQTKDADSLTPPSRIM